MSKSQLRQLWESIEHTPGWRRLNDQISIEIFLLSAGKVG